MDISRWIERHADFTPDKIALRHGETSLTYSAMFERVREFARALASAGLTRGDVVAWWGLNSPLMVTLLFAAARKGIILATINWRLADEEVLFVLKTSGAKVVFAEGLFAARAKMAGQSVDGLRTVGADRAEELVGGLRRTNRASDADGDKSLTGSEPLLLGYTSGTTGRPKGAILTQDALAWNAINSQHMHDMSAADHVLTVLPLFHVGGLCIQTLPALHLGAMVTIHSRFLARDTLVAIERDRPSLTVLVPATFAALLAEPGFPSTSFSSLRAIATGSTDVPIAQIEAFRSRGVPVIQVYGATETGPLAIYQRIPDSPVVGSIGKPALHCEIRLVDREGRDCREIEAGEILVKGRNVTAGYWRDDAATRSALHDGWFRTGDIAQRDERGFYWFRDRIKNVIISGGENIYPAELERVLNECPAILEAAIVGKPDDRWGETPVAVVVCAESAVLSAAEVLALFEGRLARYKHPKDVRFVDRLPRNAMGKVETAVLKAMVAGTAA